MKRIEHLKCLVFSEIEKKIGTVAIRLESTPNAKARLTIGVHRRDFIHQKDALQWLIYSYNLKHLKNVFEQRSPKRIVETTEVTKPVLIENAAKKLFDKITQEEYFSMEIYREIEEHFYLVKAANTFTEQEMEYVTVMVIEQLKKLIDETFIHKRHVVLKKYLGRLKARVN